VNRRFCLQKGGSQEHISLRQHNLAAVGRIVKFWGFPPKDNNNITYSFNNNCQTAGVTRNKMIYRPSNIQVNKLPGKTLHISLLYAHLPPHRWMDYSTVDGATHEVLASGRSRMRVRHLERSSNHKLWSLFLTSRCSCLNGWLELYRYTNAFMQKVTSLVPAVTVDTAYEQV